MMNSNQNQLKNESTIVEDEEDFNREQYLHNENSILKEKLTEKDKIIHHLYQELNKYKFMVEESQKKIKNLEEINKFQLLKLSRTNLLRNDINSFQDNSQQNEENHTYQTPQVKSSRGRINSMYTSKNQLNQLPIIQKQDQNHSKLILQNRNAKNNNSNKQQIYNSSITQKQNSEDNDPIIQHQQQEQQYYYQDILNSQQSQQNTQSLIKSRQQRVQSSRKKPFEYQELTPNHQIRKSNIQNQYLNKNNSTNTYDHNHKNPQQQQLNNNNIFKNISPFDVSEQNKNSNQIHQQQQINTVQPLSMQQLSEEIPIQNKNNQLLNVQQQQYNINVVNRSRKNSYNTNSSGNSKEYQIKQHQQSSEDNVVQDISNNIMPLNSGQQQQMQIIHIPINRLKKIDENQVQQQFKQRRQKSNTIHINEK